MLLQHNHRLPHKLQLYKDWFWCPFFGVHKDIALTAPFMYRKGAKTIDKLRSFVLDNCLTPETLFPVLDKRWITLPLAPWSCDPNPGMATDIKDATVWEFTTFAPDDQDLSDPTVCDGLKLYYVSPVFLGWMMYRMKKCGIEIDDLDLFIAPNEHTLYIYRANSPLALIVCIVYTDNDMNMI